MSPKSVIQVVKNSINQASYDEDIWFRWKTPDDFVYNRKVYKMNDEAKKELREEVGKLIKIYINSRECID